MVESILSVLGKKFSSLATYKLLNKTAKNGKKYITGLNEIGKLLLLSQVAKDNPKKIIYIVKNDNSQVLLKRELKQSASTDIYIYPDLKSEKINRQEYINNFQLRATTTKALKDNDSGIFIFPINALIEPLTIPVKGVELKINSDYKPEAILAKLIVLGYERQNKVFKNGEIAMRDGILDIFPIGKSHPLRFEFEGETIVKINEFDPVSNQTIKKYNQIDIEAIKNEKMSTYLLDIILDNPKAYIPIFDKSDELYQLLYELYQGNQQTSGNGILTTVSKQLDEINSWNIVNIPPTEENLIRFDFVQAPSFANDLDKFAKEIKKYSNQNWQIIITTEKEKQLLPVLQENQIVFKKDIKAKIALLNLKLPRGFMSPSLKIILLTDTEIFSPITEKIQTNKITPKRRQLAFLSQIEKGDYVVHTDHGIGKLIDINTITINNISREYLIIQYAGSDKIYVPIEQIDKVGKYISVDGSKPVLSKLNSQSWKRMVTKVKKDSQEFAKELLDLYAKRSIKEGIAFNSGDFWEKALSDSFTHQETPDQEQVIQDILNDMEKPKPMDRLLVADVGFGKTEVAIRATFKAVTSGFQVAFLAPTTILTEQHLKTFTERLSPFGTQIAALSRFRTPAEQKRIIAGIKNKEVDVVIGTHRLLSKDIKFANLGLVIIDEEQRFGVRHKEKLKMLRSEVDVLSLTATPIPRTLNLALSGIRDISIIETPPINRLPIQTTVAPFDMESVKNSILNEIKRGGQIYFVHNRVATIASMTNKLKEVLPEVRFVYAHGQMPERLLAKIMEDFTNGKYDCLVASTIIENGLDNPNVNTLIIDNAGNFGLSQLHQLRGRIGRGKVQAYSYLYYNAGKLAGKALERLKTIARYTELGSGYQIALRDLQIRGAGGVLSRKQHGHISAVGLTLYTKLLNRAVEELKTGYRPRVDAITVDLPISAYLPNNYIDNEAQRIKTYQQLALIEDEKELKEAQAELFEKFGELPKEVISLFQLLGLKLTALNTQKIKSMIAKNTAPSGSKTPKYVININLISKIEDKNVISALSKFEAKIIDDNIQLPLSAIGDNWIEGIKKIIKLIK